jgi:hypothetical protein
MQIQRYKWPAHLDKLHFPIIWQWFSQWHQLQSMTKSHFSNHNKGTIPTKSNLIFGDDGAAEEEDIVCKVEPLLSQQG